MRKTQTEISAALDHERALEMIAIRERLAIPPELRDALDAAAETGHPPTIAMLIHPADGLPSHWDGAVNGEHIVFAEAMLWCSLRDHHGWGIPADETMPAIDDACRTSGRLIEIGPGTGYWAAVLAARGIDVRAVEKANTAWNRHWLRQWHPIEYGCGIDAARHNPGVPVLMSWPDTEGLGLRLADALEAGRVLLRCGPRTVTGDDAFNSALDQCFDKLDAVPVGCASGRPDDTLEVLVRNDRPAGTVAINPRRHALNLQIPETVS